MASQFRQDMPPPGGYAPIKWGRVGQKTIINGWMALGIYVAVTGWAAGKYWNWKQYLAKLDVEKYDCFVAMEPFIAAERDRAFLRNMRIARDDERELMKNHPGWIVGTMYGDPLYKTIGKNDMPDIVLCETYMHRPFKNFYEYAWPDMWT